ncbi:MAG: hypothetical protein GXX85_00710 [Ignavibacteria bacterium]|nr:hypothetical protein [Ignavibacteria bacterium]
MSVIKKNFTVELIKMIKKVSENISGSVSEMKNSIFTSAGSSKRESEIKDIFEIELCHYESKKYLNTTEFWFKPHSDIKIDKVELSVKNFNETINGDIKTIFKAGNWQLLVAYEGVKNGQEWEFNFVGKFSNNDEDFQFSKKYQINNTN